MMIIYDYFRSLVLYLIKATKFVNASSALDLKSNCFRLSIAFT